MGTIDISKFKTPGQLLEFLLEERGWTKRVLSIVLNMSEPSVNKIIADKQAITPQVALILEETFQLDAGCFLDLQRKYDLARARLSSRPDPTRGTRARLFGDLPVTEMMKRGWLDADDLRDVPAVEAALTRFFGVQSVGEIEILPHAAKRTEVFTEPTPAQLAWLYRVRQIAGEMIVSRYSPDAVRAALPKLHALMSAPQEARKVPRILAECGIRYVIVESLPSAKIDGVCFWLNDLSPVIGMTLRHDRIDNFWFVLRHELEHVLRRHGIRADGVKAMMLDAELEGERAGVGSTVADEERAANTAASSFCVPSAELDAFIARKAPFFPERDILGFARTLGVHPGIVAGQLQHRTGLYKRFRDHLVKIRTDVLPSAAVDGWGNTYPVGV